LYAAGECACVSINGSNRLGSNSLTELFVFGARAGRAAGAFAREHDQVTTGPLEKQAADEQQRIRRDYLTKSGGTERIASVRNELWHAMEEGAGIYRTEESLKRTIETLRELHERYQKLQIDDRSNCFNTELVAALELRNRLDVAAAVLHSARERRESRGSHQRTDHPRRDDENYLKHTLAYRSSEQDPPRIEYLDVTITKWPPAERVYGAASPQPAGEAR
ncbi:MAG: succinate dehydrogenase/fumarate reductase flavoprotein subunit, partial [Planctomycetota bacterium]